MSIVVQDVTKEYGEQKALNGISFGIGSGEIVGFLGPNGAGKTTLMKILTGYIAPTSGNAWINNVSVTRDSIKAKRRIGYLPETNPLYHEMYVWEYLQFVAGIYQKKKKKDRIGELIEITGLTPEQKKKIGALSKGFRQRVGLAQALIHDPDVLILDEPTSGLDPNQIVEIRELISTLGKEKLVLLSTHIMQEVESICNRVLIIHKGDIIADDDIRQIRNLTADHAEILVEFNQAVEPAKLKQIEGINEVIDDGDKRYRVLGSEEKDLREELFQFAVDNGLKVLSLHKKEKKLEHIFQQLTGKESLRTPTNLHGP